MPGQGLSLSSASLVGLSLCPSRGPPRCLTCPVRGAEEAAPSPWVPPTQEVLGLPGATQPQVEVDQRPLTDSGAESAPGLCKGQRLKDSQSGPQSVCCMQGSMCACVCVCVCVCVCMLPHRHQAQTFIFVPLLVSSSQLASPICPSSPHPEPPVAPKTPGYQALRH